MYRIFSYPVFDEYINKFLSKDDINKLKRSIGRLKLNPYIGKPLSYNFLREFKFGDKRVYFLIYEDICLVLMIAGSDKKSQQKTIDKIKGNLKEFKEYAYMIYEKI